MDRVVNLFLGCIFAVAVVSCGPIGDPADSVESYLESVVEADVVRAANLACTKWEAQARTEASSFEAVQASLEGLACRVASEQDEFKLVSCEGAIVANYGGEAQEMDLGRRTYRVLWQDGAWRICGYQ